MLSTFAFFWMSGFDIIYALQDIEFDRDHGLHSIPAALGSRGAQIVAGITHAAALAILVALVVSGGNSGIAYLALAVSAIAFICAFLPSIPLPVRFFPLSAVAGIAGAFVPFF